MTENTHAYKAGHHAAEPKPRHAGDNKPAFPYPASRHAGKNVPVERHEMRRLAGVFPHGFYCITAPFANRAARRKEERRYNAEFISTLNNRALTPGRIAYRVKAEGKLQPAKAKPANLVARLGRKVARAIAKSCGFFRPLTLTDFLWRTGVSRAQIGTLHPSNSRRAFA